MAARYVAWIILKTQYFNDSLKYHILKHKKLETSDALKNIKNDRAKKNEEHLESLKIQEKYFSLDPVEIPGIIFCDESIISFYNINQKTYCAGSTQPSCS